LYRITLILFFTLLLSNCSKRSVDPASGEDQNRLVNKYGTDLTFDLATWNVEQFPLQDRSTVAYLAQMIKDMDLDLIALQEINDTGYFNSLLDSLPDYAGYASALPSDFLKLAIIYKKNLVSITTPVQIYTDDWYAFPRPPLVTYVRVKKEDQTVFDFTLIINHLKAFSGTENEQRRRDACEKLNYYISNNVLNSDDRDCISLGDFNDQLDDPVVENVFNIFLDDSLNFKFLTESLLGQASYIGIDNSLIDHVLISSDVNTEYEGGTTEILYLEKEFDRYTTHISDHRPVLSRFPVF